MSDKLYANVVDLITEAMVLRRTGSNSESLYRVKVADASMLWGLDTATVDEIVEPWVDAVEDGSVGVAEAVSVVYEALEVARIDYDLD